LPVAVHGEGVDAEGVGQQVEVLALMSDGVGPAKPQGVVDGAVDALGVVAALVEIGEVRVGGRDGSDVLGPVELACLVVVVAV
jgi:hypothetical protein